MSVVTLAAIEVRRRHRRRVVRVRAMAPQAPAHGQWRLLLDALHPFDAAVTRLALDARDHVLTVVEVDEVRQVVDLRPRDRPREGDQLLQLLEIGRLFLEHAVTVHADVRGRYAGMAARARAEMAVEARHAKIAGVSLVRERDRLRRRVAFMPADARPPPGP